MAMLSIKITGAEGKSFIRAIDLLRHLWYGGTILR